MTIDDIAGAAQGRRLRRLHRDRMVEALDVILRLFAGDGEELVLSRAFADPKASGVLQKRMKSLGAAAAVVVMQPQRFVLEIDGEAVATSPEYADQNSRDAALARLRDALDQLAAQD